MSIEMIRDPRSVEFRGHDGIRLAADEWGAADAAPVVLLHGGGQTRHAWRNTSQAVAAAGWRVLAIDLRGHGDSDWPEIPAYGLDHFADDVLAVLAQIHARPVLVGASLGGTMGLAAQGRTDEQLYSGLVLVDVAPRLEWAGVERITQFMLAHLEGFASLDDAAEAVAAYAPHRPRPSSTDGLRRNLTLGSDRRWRWRWDPRFLTSQPELADGATELRRRRVAQVQRMLTDAARRVEGPVLLIRGATSDVVSLEGVEEFLAAVPHAHFVDVAGASHMVAGDRNDAFTDALVSFLGTASILPTRSSLPSPHMDDIHRDA